MICPACKNQMKTETVNSVTLDVCSKGCGGIWFDQFEFKKFDEEHEPDPTKVISLSLPAQPVSKSKDLLSCPRCEDSRIRMQRFYSSPKRSVTIDQCPKCAGTWLDVGELAQVRQEYKTEDERRNAAEAFANEAIAPSLKAEAAKSQAQLQGVQKVGRALRFISPSYFISKK